MDWIKEVEAAQKAKRQIYFQLTANFIGFAGFISSPGPPDSYTGR